MEQDHLIFIGKVDEFCRQHIEQDDHGIYECAVLKHWKTLADILNCEPTGEAVIAKVTELVTESTYLKFRETLDKNYESTTRNETNSSMGGC